MADDPRIDLAAVRRDITRANDPAVQGEGRGVVEGRVRYAAAALLAEVERLADLRALLDDEDRALEVMAAASWESWKANGTKWADQSKWYRAKWLTLQRSEYIAVLAGLREEAGL